ncbi:MAG: response regulator [Planctomycetes bacterium]|nr:response regulator [Planctomycetota bacterium]
MSESKRTIEVLICDDSPISRSLASTVISKLPIPVGINTAGNGKEAYSYLIENKGECDILLLDINMPEMDGIELLREMKKEDTPLPYTIVMSADNVKRTVVDALSLGAKDFLNKPYTKTTLQEKIESAIKSLDSA